MREIYFQIFVTFSENLNFNKFCCQNSICISQMDHFTLQRKKSYPTITLVGTNMIKSKPPKIIIRWPSITTHFSFIFHIIKRLFFHTFWWFPMRKKYQISFHKDTVADLVWYCPKIIRQIWHRNLWNLISLHWNTFMQGVYFETSTLISGYIQKKKLLFVMFNLEIKC